MFSFAHEKLNEGSSARGFVKRPVICADANTFSPGGGGVLPCMRIGYVPRERPPFSALNFRSGSYHFHKLPQKSVPEHHHFTYFGGFCRSGDHHFQNVFNFKPFIASHGRFSPNKKRSAAPRVSGRPERQPDACCMQFRRFAFSRSKRLKLVPEPPHFQA